MTPDRPDLWLLVGGNGAGKSTFYRLYLQPHGIPFVNADLIARQLWPRDPEAHSYQAALLAGNHRRQLLQEGRTFCFETVFSHVSKVDFVAEAKALGFAVRMFLIHVTESQLNEARVTQRVNEGGHSVPRDKIVERIPRILANVIRALPLCDELILLDNSSRDDPFRPVAHWQDQDWTVSARPLPDWARRIVEPPPR